MGDASPLPGILAEVEAIAGRAAALALAEALGGETVHIPRAENLADDHCLVWAVGASAAAISSRYAGEKVYVPRARRALVLHLAAAGWPSRRIASRLGITSRAVREYQRA